VELDGHILVFVQNLFAQIHARSRNAQGRFHLCKRHARLDLIDKYATCGVTKFRSIGGRVEGLKPMCRQRVGGIYVFAIATRAKSNASFPDLEALVGERTDSAGNRMRRKEAFWGDNDLKC